MKKVYIGKDPSKEYIAINSSKLSISNVMTFKKGLAEYLKYYKDNIYDYDESWYKGYFTGHACYTSTFVLESQCELVSIKFGKHWKTFILDTKTMRAYDFIVEKGKGYYILNTVYELLGGIK